MGSCCSRISSTQSAAFAQELDMKLLEDLAPKLNKSARVLILKLNALHHILAVGSFSNSTNAFVEVRLLPADEITGDQRQTSSIRPGTTSPLWVPPEKFRFVIPDVKKTKVLLSVYHYNEENPKESIPIGDCVLHLGSMKLTKISTPHTFDLVNPSNGQSDGEARVMMSLLTTREAQNLIEEGLYEYQERSTFGDWEGMQYPGRWSTSDGKKFAEELVQLAKPVDKGWTVTLTWNVLSAPAYLDANDPDGWQYASSLDSPYWHGNPGSGLYLRRRYWNRTQEKLGANDLKPNFN